MSGKRKLRPIFHKIDRETVLKINRKPNRRDLSWPPPQLSSSQNSHVVNLTKLDTTNEIFSKNDSYCKVKPTQKKSQIFGKNLISYKTILLDKDSKVIESKNQRRFSSAENIFLTTNYDKSITENIQKMNEYMNFSNKIIQEIKNNERRIGLNNLLNLIQRNQGQIAYLNDDKFIEFLIKNKDITNEYYDPEYFNENFSDDLKHFEKVKESNKILSNFLEYKKNQDIELLPKLKIDGTTKKKVSFSLPSSPIIEVVDSKYKNYHKITRQYSLDSQKFSDFTTNQFEPVKGIYMSIKKKPCILFIIEPFFVFSHILCNIFVSSMYVQS